LRGKKAPRKCGEECLSGGRRLSIRRTEAGGERETGNPGIEKQEFSGKREAAIQTNHGKKELTGIGRGLAAYDAEGRGRL